MLDFGKFIMNNSKQTTFMPQWFFSQNYARNYYYYYYYYYYTHMLLVMDSSLWLMMSHLPWFMYAAGPSQSCDKFFLQENMMLKSFSPGRSNFFSSSSVISAMHPQRNGNLSPLLLQKIKGQIQYYILLQSK